MKDEPCFHPSGFLVSQFCNSDKPSVFQRSICVIDQPETAMSSELERVTAQLNILQRGLRAMRGKLIHLQMQQRCISNCILRHQCSVDSDDAQGSENSESSSQVSDDSYSETESTSSYECITEAMKLKGKIENLKSEISSKQVVESKLKRIIDYHKALLKTIWKYVEAILEQDEGNKKDKRFGTTPAIVWELFATALFEAEGRVAEHCGGANDKGVDVLLYDKSRKVEAVVQVKRGGYFGRGQGNSIVLSLIGSCVLYNVREGIIFCNEFRSALKQPTKNLIKEFSGQNYKVYCCFIENIWHKVKTLGFKALRDLRNSFSISCMP